MKVLQAVHTLPLSKDVLDAGLVTYIVILEHWKIEQKKFYKFSFSLGYCEFQV